MGGFYGGHGGGGGFSGGGGFHYHGGGRGQRHYYGKKEIDGGPTPYGTYRGMPLTYKTALLYSIFITILGVILFFSFFSFKTTATVTHTYDNGYYELYDFEYSAYGNTYKGHGDDDFKYYKQYKVLTGEKYNIYYRVINPSKYYFENPYIYTFVGILFVIIGVICICATIARHEYRMKMAYRVGDVNKDGKIDERDLDALPTKPQLTAEDLENPEIKECPYCGTPIPKGAIRCPGCGTTDINQNTTFNF